MRGCENILSRAAHSPPEGLDEPEVRRRAAQRLSEVLECEVGPSELELVHSREDIGEVLYRSQVDELTFLARAEYGHVARPMRGLTVVVEHLWGRFTDWRGRPIWGRTGPVTSLYGPGRGHPVESLASVRLSLIDEEREAEQRVGDTAGALWVALQATPILVIAAAINYAIFVDPVAGAIAAAAVIALSVACFRPWMRQISAHSAYRVSSLPKITEMERGVGASEASVASG